MSALAEAAPPVQQDRRGQVADVARRVHLLEAQGYPLTWLEQHVGVNLRSLFHLDPTAPAPGQITDAVMRLACSLGEALAQPRYDLTEREIRSAQRRARAAGYFPPLCYDEDTGELIPDAVRDSWRSNVDTIAAKRLRIAASLRAGRTSQQAQVDAGASRRTVERLGLQMSTLAAQDPTWEHRLDVELARWDQPNCPDSPTYIALTLRMLSPAMVGPTHPDCVRYLTEAAGPRRRPSYVQAALDVTL